MPIIFLTAKSQTKDIVRGFSSGGTDYVKKPFSMEELIARIDNQLLLRGFRNSYEIPGKLVNIKLGSCHFYPGKFELHTESDVIKLSHRESQVLSLFATHQNQMLDRKKILLSVWGDDSFFNSRTLDVYVRRLRKYFSNDPAIQIITLKGTGYHFNVEKSVSL